jgi:hypothetical protein
VNLHVNANSFSLGVPLVAADRRAAELVQDSTKNPHYRARIRGVNQANETAPIPSSN